MTTLPDWLRKIIDTLQIHSRAGWATVLGVSETAIESWVVGAELPRPEKLHGIIVLLRERYRERPGVQEVLDTWKTLAKEDLTYVWPSGAQTFGHYVVLPLWHDLEMAIDSRSSEVQEELLTAFVARAQQYTAGPTAPVVGIECSFCGQLRICVRGEIANICGPCSGLATDMLALPLKDA